MSGRYLTQIVVGYQGDSSVGQDGISEVWKLPEAIEMTTEQETEFCKRLQALLNEFVDDDLLMTTNISQEMELEAERALDEEIEKDRRARSLLKNYGYTIGQQVLYWPLASGYVLSTITGCHIVGLQDDFFIVVRESASGHVRNAFPHEIFPTIPSI